MPDDTIISGRNLLLDSGRRIENNYYKIGQWDFGNEKPVEGETYIIQIKGTLGTDRQKFGVYNSDDTHYICQLINRDKDGVYRIKIKWPALNGSTNTSLWIFQFTAKATTNSIIEWIKMERGTIPTSWTLAPQDTFEKLDKKPVIYGAGYGTLGNAAILAQQASLGDVFNKIFEIATKDGTWCLGVHPISNRLMFKYIYKPVDGQEKHTTYCFSPKEEGGETQIK